MINSEQFTKRLQKVIDYYNESASSFATKVGVQRSSISHILSGRNKPSLDFVMKILDSYPEVELYWLLNGKGAFPKSAIQEKKVATSSLPKSADLFSAESQDLQNDNSEAQNNPISKNLDVQSSHGKQIDRIVIFYTDGTFSNFKNS